MKSQKISLVIAQSSKKSTRTPPVAFVSEAKTNFQNERKKLHVGEMTFITRLQFLVNEKFSFASEQQQRVSLFLFVRNKKKLKNLQKKRLSPPF